MKRKPKLVAKSFKAILERIPSKLGWIIIRIPFDVSKVWETRAKVRVKGEINGFAFRSSVFPTSKGYHCMLIKRSMQTGANAAPGETAEFRLEPDTAKRVAIVPNELVRILKLPDMQERLQALGAEVVGSSPAEFATYLAAEIDRWSKVAKAAHVKLD